MDKKQARLLGLGKNETHILATLTSRPLSISSLARATGIPRTTLNYEVQQLHKRGLLAPLPRGKRRLWTVEPSAHAPTVFVSSNTSIEVHRGTRALYHLWWSFSALPKNKRLYGIQPDSSFNAALSHILKEVSYEKLIGLNERIRNNKIVVEGIVHEKSADTVPKTLTALGKDPARFLGSFLGRLADTAKLPDEFMDNKAELFMRDDMVALILWEDEVAVVIRNKELVSFFKGMFESVKYLCKRYDQSERMAQKIVELNSHQ